MRPPSAATDERPERRLRPASPRDRAFLAELSGRVFGKYGDYDRLIPEWLGGPGVRGLIALDGDEPVGFALTCLVQLPDLWRIRRRARGPSRRGGMAVDLLAIAVVPERQGRGVGRWLLREVVARARDMAGSTDLPLVDVTLTVARENDAARRLFESVGFREVQRERTTYPRGQEAVQMALPINR